MPFRHCSWGAFAKVLDQFSGIGSHSGTAVGMHLQKFWISFAESSVMMTSEHHFGRPDGIKLALERRLEQPCGAKLSLERRFGAPSGVTLALKRRLGRKVGPEMVTGTLGTALGAPLGRPKTGSRLHGNFHDPSARRVTYG